VRPSRQKTAPAVAVRRCAIYTRKSTTHGLDQESSSLDAQWEACAGYVRAQPGYDLVEERYDDGGFSGANVDRPAFQRLMRDVDEGRVDVVVVDKIDRLSRSLLDFAGLMERLRKAGAFFISVTQPFLSADSDAMAQLLLNILMAFAQFEREMISERTRDKIAASRRRGMWTGGPTPLGYKLVNKKLVVDEVEAHAVRHLFTLFLEHRQMARVAQLLNERKLLPRGMRGRPAKDGLLWRKESVARILRSPQAANPGGFRAGASGAVMAIGERWHHPKQHNIRNVRNSRQSPLSLPVRGRNRESGPDKSRTTEQVGTEQIPDLRDRDDPSHRVGAAAGMWAAHALLAEVARRLAAPRRPAVGHRRFLSCRATPRLSCSGSCWYSALGFAPARGFAGSDQRRQHDRSSGQ
jgi:DNA invertase Pin-like site-specific DNA recombinase